MKLTENQKRTIKSKLKPLVMEVLNEEKIEPSKWRTRETEKKCSDLANYAFLEIHKYTRQFGGDNSAYAKQFMIERLSEMIAEQV